MKFVRTIHQAKPIRFLSSLSHKDVPAAWSAPAAWLERMRNSSAGSLPGQHSRCLLVTKQKREGRRETLHALGQPEDFRNI